MTTERDVKLNVTAEVASYQKEFAKIEGFTEKSAARAAVAFVKSNEKAAKDAAAIQIAEAKKGATKALRAQEAASKKATAAAVKAAEDSAKAAEDAAEKSAEAWRNAGTAIVGAFAAAATAALAFASATFEARTEQINLSEATGIALDTLAGLEVAASRSGVSIDEITGGFEDFGEVLFDFSQDGGRAVEALELLDIEVENVDGSLRDTDTVLREVIKGMSGLENQATKNAVAQQLFGDAGNRLNAVLGDGTLEDYIASAELYGTVIDEEAVAATKEWNRATAELTSTLKGSANELLALLDLGGNIRGFTLGFVFLKNIASEAIDVVIMRMGRLGDVIDAVLAGDTELAAIAAADALDLSGKRMEQAEQRALAATRAFFDNSKALDAATDSADRQSTALGTLSADTKKAEDAAKAFAKEQARLGKEQAARGKAFAKEQARLAKEAEARTKEFLKQLAEIGAAEDDLAGIVREATQDQLDSFQLIEQARQDQIASVVELEAVLGETMDTEAARAEINLRALRDISEAEAQQQAQRLEDRQELEDIDNQIHSFFLQREAEKEARARQVATSLISSANSVLGIQLAATQRAADAEKGSIAELEVIRQELVLSLDEAATLDEEQDIERKIREVDRTIDKNELILANEQGQIEALFRLQQSLQIVATNISGAAAVVAALSPPPTGLGPVAGAGLAVAVGLTTAAQTAFIAAQQPPQFDIGFPGFTTGPDNFAATLRAGEGVTNQRATDALGGPRGINELNNTGQLSAQQEARGAMDRSRLGRLLGQLMVEEMGAGRELTRDNQRRTGKRAGVRPVYQVR